MLGPHTCVQLCVQVLEPVPDLGPGLAADLLPEPRPVRVEAERYDAAPLARTGPVVGAVTAVGSVVEVDAVFAVATARSPSHTGILRSGSHIGSPTESQKIEQVT